MQGKRRLTRDEDEPYGITPAVAGKKKVRRPLFRQVRIIPANAGKKSASALA